MEEMEETPNSHFSIGQLVWAQTGKFPYWPCTVTLDKKEKRYKRFRKYGTAKSIAIHVQYFGYNHSHNWVAERSLIPFTGLADFHKLAETAKCKVKVKNGHLNPYRVKSVIRDKWNLAIDEATRVLTMKRDNGMKPSNIQVETKNSEHETTKTLGKHCQKGKFIVGSVVPSEKHLEYKEVNVLERTFEKLVDHQMVYPNGSSEYKDSSMKYKAVKHGKILELKDYPDDSLSYYTSACQEIEDMQKASLRHKTELIHKVTGQLTENKEKRDRRFAIGDLVWAQVGTYPYWPGIVVLDKKEKLYTKFRKYGKVTTTVFHVQFFGDNNSHTWVSDRFMMPFTGLADFHKLANISKCTIQRKNRHSCNPYSPQPSVRGRWNHAIDEATEALIMSNDDRVELFNPRNGRAVHERIMALWLYNKRLKHLGPNNKRLKREMIRTSSDNINSRGSEGTVPRSVESPKTNTETPPIRPPSDQNFSERYKTVIQVTDSQLKEELLDSGSYYTSNGKEIEGDQEDSLTDLKYKMRSTSTWEKSQQEPPLVESYLEYNEIPFAQQKKVWTIAANKKLFPYDLFYNTEYERVCRKCEKPGDLRRCKGPCRFYFHLSCNDGLERSNREKKNMIDGERNAEIVSNEPFQCTDCLAGIEPDCLICTRHGIVDKVVCSASHCERNYHGKCLNAWPQSYWQNGRLTCPRHTCHTCTAIHPQNDIFKFAKDELVRCVKCPSAYHTATSCIPAASRIESNSLEIICAKHFTSTDPLISADWCFMCKRGGSLVRCDTCPKSAHLKCLGLKSPHDHFTCKNCKYGRLPVYGEVVWVKLKKFRWWPARISLPHHELPGSLYTMKHAPGEFGVNFLGTVNFQWVHRGQVFPYENGDASGEIASKYGERNVDGAYAQALKEAKDLHESFKIERQKARSFVEDESEDDKIANLSKFYKFK